MTMRQLPKVGDLFLWKQQPVYIPSGRDEFAIEVTSFLIGDADGQDSRPDFSCAGRCSRGSWGL